LIQPVAPDNPCSGKLPTMLGGSWASPGGVLTGAQLRIAATAVTRSNLIFLQWEKARIWLLASSVGDYENTTIK
jgi:hypothetical protein